MAGTADPIPQQVSREATDWLILLQEAPEDAALAARFEAWLRQSPVNGAAWEETRRAGLAIAGATPALAARWRPYLDDGRAGKPAAPTIRRRRLIGLGAGAAMAASLAGAALGPGLLLALRADHVTGTAEVASVRLADGSLVTLAPETAIRVGDTPGERRLELLAGEAFIEAAPDPARPFRAAAGPVDVVVLGTGFAVRRDDAAAEVAVEHGVVRVDHASADPPVSEMLTAGRSVRVTWSGATAAGGLPAAQVAAWRHGMLIAQDQPLGEVVGRLRRHYAGRIVVTDAALAAGSVTGVYNLADPVEALRGIARARKAVVRQVTPWLLLVSPSDRYF